MKRNGRNPRFRRPKRQRIELRECPNVSNINLEGGKTVRQDQEIGKMGPGRDRDSSARESRKIVRLKAHRRPRKIIEFQMTENTITSEQCRAARELLGLSQDDVCDLANVSIKTLVDFENSNTKPYKRRIIDIQNALENAGAVFIEPIGLGPGVRLVMPKSKYMPRR